MAGRVKRKMLTPLQWTILKNAAERPGETCVAHYRDLENFDPSVGNTMEGKGLIIREVDPKRTGRGKYAELIYPTDFGLDVYDVLMKHNAA